MARRSGSDWYIGAMTDGARTVTIPLSSLNLGSGNYTAYVYKDGATGESISKVTSTVTSASTLTIPLIGNRRSRGVDFEDDRTEHASRSVYVL